MDTPCIDSEKHWFALRDLKRPNALLPAYKQLEQAGIEVFTPMIQRIFTKNGRRVKLKVPIMQDLLFVNENREKIDPIIDKTPTLQYRFKKGGKYCEPITVPEKSMRQFIGAALSGDAPRFYSSDEITSLMCGKNIRIVGGILDGYEGKLQTIRGSKKKRLIIILPSLLAVSVEINDEFIEIQ